MDLEAVGLASARLDRPGVLPSKRLPGASGRFVDGSTGSSLVSEADRPMNHHRFRKESADDSELWHPLYAMRSRVQHNRQAYTR